MQTNMKTSKFLSFITAAIILLGTYNFAIADTTDNGQQNNNNTRNYGQQMQTNVTLQPSSADSNMINNLFKNAQYKDMTDYKPENPFYNTDDSSANY